MQKRRSRPITVNGIKFRYVVSCDWSVGGVLNVRITVQNVDANGSRLYVNRERASELGAELGDFVMAGQTYPVITTGHVEALIRRALESGWRHASSGPGYYLPDREAAGGDAAGVSGRTAEVRVTSNNSHPVYEPGGTLRLREI